MVSAGRFEQELAKQWVGGAGKFDQLERSSHIQYRAQAKEGSQRQTRGHPSGNEPYQCGDAGLEHILRRCE